MKIAQSLINVKVIIFITILMCFLVSLSAKAQSFKYNKVMTVERGADFFAVDHQTVEKKGGDIIVNTDNVVIDGKEYKITKRLSDNVFKAKNGIIEFLFNYKDVLYSIRVRKFDTDVYYSINNDNQLITKNTN